MTQIDSKKDFEKGNIPFNSTEKERTWYEILTILTVSLVAFSNGLTFSWTSPYLLKIVEDKETYNITEEEASYFVVIRSIAMTILSPLLVPLANIFGRKKLLLASSIPYALSWIIKAFSKNLWFIYFARFCAGVGDSVMVSCTIPFVGEVASPKVRGVWGAAITIFGLSGQLSINILGKYFSIPTASYICVTVPVFFFTIFYFMPESPYYYVVMGQYEDAKESLKKLRRRKNIDDEFSAIKKSIESEEKGTWKELLTVKANRRALNITIFLLTAQIFAGIWTFGPYLQFIFDKAGTGMSAELSSLIYASCNLGIYLLTPSVSNKLGRRISLMLSLSLTGVILIAEGIYFLIDMYYPTNDLTKISWFPLVGMLVFLLSTSFGIGIIPFLMPGELFAVGVKSLGMAVFTSFSGIASIAANILFYYLDSSMGLCGPFLLFGVSCLINAIITFVIVPETKNKSLEEIQLALRK